MLCPMRGEVNPVFKLSEEDVWREQDGRCSYCGSLSPEAFFKAIEDGDKLIPTDKNYKVYVGDHKKFYFPHLSVEEQNRFIALLNAKKVNFSEPGYFYVLPFFIKRGD